MVCLGPSVPSSSVPWIAEDCDQGRIYLPERSHNDEKFALFWGMETFYKFYLFFTLTHTFNATFIVFPLIPYLL